MPIVLIVGLVLLLILLIIFAPVSASPMSPPETKSEAELLKELLKQAVWLKGHLSSSARDYLKNAAAGFQLDRSLRIQEHLFREDLAWQSRGFSEGQVNLMVFVVVSLSLERVEDEVAVLEKKEDVGAHKRIGYIKLYKHQALALLDNLSEGLEDLSPSEFLFSF